MKHDYLYSVEDMNRYFGTSFMMLGGAIIHVRDVQWDNGAGRDDADGKSMWPAVLRYRTKEKGKYSDKAKAFKHIDEIMGAMTRIPRCFGYMNMKHACVYLNRSPERTAIKGLQPARLAKTLDSGVYSNMEAGGLSEHDMVEKLCFERFPSFQEVFSRICEERSMSAAWHTDWALCWNSHFNHPSLNYRGNTVGMVRSRDPRDIMLHSKANQLQESFEESKREGIYRE